MNRSRPAKRFLFISPRAFVVSANRLKHSEATGMPNIDQHASLRLGIITYDHAHLKTEQLVHRFLLRNTLAKNRKLDLVLLALPFSSRPSRTVLLPHRPDQEKSV